MKSLAEKSGVTQKEILMYALSLLPTGEDDAEACLIAICQKHSTLSQLLPVIQRRHRRKKVPAGFRLKLTPHPSLHPDDPQGAA